MKHEHRPVTSPAPSELSGGASVAHTPTPWDVSSGLYVVSDWGRVIAKCDGMNIAEIDVPTEQMFANAARIVACVNACEGVSNEELAANGIRKTKLGAMRSERDELRHAALIASDRLIDVSDLLFNEPPCSPENLAERVADVRKLLVAALNRSTDK